MTSYPTATRQAIPDLRITSHVYRRVAERFPGIPVSLIVRRLTDELRKGRRSNYLKFWIAPGLACVARLERDNQGHGHAVTTIHEA